MIHIKRLDEMQNKEEVRFANKANQENFLKFQNICEEEDWTFYADVQRDEIYMEIGKYSPSGQDFTFTIWAKKNAPNEIKFSQLVDEYIDSYEPEEEAELWSEGTGEYDDDGREIRVGKNGAPEKFEDIVEDMQACKDNMKELSSVLKRNNL